MHPGATGTPHNRDRNRQRYVLNRLLFCLGMGLLILASNASLVMAKSYEIQDAITVTSQTQKIDFPKSIDFQLSARDAGGSITQATLYIMTPMGNEQEQHTVVASQPGAIVHLSWHETFKERNFLPPGTPVTYHWEISDSAGGSHTSDTRSFQVNDTRYNWQESDENKVQIKSYNNNEATTQALQTNVEKALKTITQNLGKGPNRPITLWIYKDRKTFKSALPPDTEEWVGGIAFPNINQGMFVVEDPQDSTLIRDLPHEMTHLILHQVASTNLDIPRWFDEGLAVYNQEYHEGEMSFQLREAFKSHTLLRLTDITDSFPADGDEAYLAYAQSWNLIDYMYKTYGQRKMDALYQAMQNNSQSFDGDLSQSLGTDTSHLENAWRLANHQAPTLTGNEEHQGTQPATQTMPEPSTFQRNLLLTLGIILLLSPEIVLAGYFVYRRQVRIRREQQLVAQQAQHILDETFAPHQPPFRQYFNTHMTNYSQYQPPNRDKM
ncbi:peptidase MA family metallohydrolase [Ktedonospora formicarum]|uniref:Peptidase MA-like domain-containing protein n=1 Tax=Ktedonospora formicarum TaxID=2778364 RepID=A0A8J3MRD7_9CHLR|nr:peptidase MA family metallohydrolase [Ktedonospora formicarum]GHO43528.1 hypothetical protein KSX_16910 [Ktedonospora formicarum]